MDGNLLLHPSSSMHVSVFIHLLQCMPPSSSYYFFILLLMSWRYTWELAPSSILQDILVTWSSSFPSSCNLETNIWFKHFLLSQPISRTQCNHYSIGIAINYQYHTWGSILFQQLCEFTSMTRYNNISSKVCLMDRGNRAWSTQRHKECVLYFLSFEGKYVYIVGVWCHECQLTSQSPHSILRWANHEG
jgi:hypothetical protein